MHNKAILPILCLSGLILISCAVQRAPAGGPEDKTPPGLISTFPAIDSTNVAGLEYVEFVFEENLNRASLINQIGFIPEIEDGYEVDWKNDRRLRLKLKSPLAENQTYVVQIGTGLKDRRGNAIPEPVILPFSTGPTIDKGRISGRVYGAEIKDAYVLAYPDADSLKDKFPLDRKSPYYTQVNKDGHFSLGYLRPDTYWVFALLDNDRDRRYRLGGDEVGFPVGAVVLDSTHMDISGINFRLTREDTLAPRPLRARAQTKRIITLSATEDVALGPDFRITLLDSVQNKDVPVRSVWVDPTDQALLWMAVDSLAKTRYLGTLDGLVDPAGNRQKESASLSFLGSEKSDTTRFRLQGMTPKPGGGSARSIAPLQLQFSLPVDSASFKGAVAVVDTHGVGIPGKWGFGSLPVPIFNPATPWPSGATVVVKLDFPNLRDVWGEAAGDSAEERRFKIWAEEELGAISGIVKGGQHPDATAVVVAISDRSKEQYRVSGPMEHPFQIPGLPEGAYHLEAFLDLNGDGVFNPGKTLPYQLAEPFVVLPDTVRVRKRWTTEGKLIDFGERR